jgi:hypothetical protein
MRSIGFKMHYIASNSKKAFAEMHLNAGGKVCTT